MKGKSYLREMASQLSPMNAILKMAKPMLPGLMEKVKGLNKPECEGGVLEEGEAHAMLSLNPMKDRIRIDIITYRLEGDQMIVSRFIPMSDFNKLTDGK
ncbi:hypothetical protein [Flavilitoribacter nigricans]|uniref:Uncharacterized protein n=1 Tax=Flavilitoribacter nigricans (strain ATCC 23147 / DSM 23189 / NBRC 102662 / NCIMB 1420 / SS-2) TaxID=1122177 RepID=A0A2D0NCD5_FLAN2|nr:hypothetical protein [Flavilitoribacter nigricans]PHN06155.1 hypothetical protein CRP01_11260 [Flavilitoribacter nigricans DSM 23189 = NBRC 102662]